MKGWTQWNGTSSEGAKRRMCPRLAINGKLWIHIWYVRKSVFTSGDDNIATSHRLYLLRSSDFIECPTHFFQQSFFSSTHVFSKSFEKHRFFFAPLFTFFLAYMYCLNRLKHTVFFAPILYLPKKMHSSHFDEKHFFFVLWTNICQLFFFSII